MARRKKDINDLNTFIPARLINRFNKLQSDFNSFLAETGDKVTELYEDINTYESVSSFDLVNGVLLVNGEEYNSMGYFSTDEDGTIYFDEESFREDLNYWFACLRRAKRYWLMGCEDLDALSEAHLYGEVEEDEEGNVIMFVSDPEHEEEDEECATNVDPITGISLDGVILPATCAALLDDMPGRTIIDDHTKVDPLQDTDYYDMHGLNDGKVIVYNAYLHCSTLLDARKLFVAHYPELKEIVYLTKSVDLDGTFSGWHAFFEGEFWLTCVVVK